MTTSQKSEVQQDTIEFTYEETTYTVEADAMNNLEVLEMVEDEKYLAVTRLLIGEDGYKAFKEASRNEKGRVPLESFEGFLQALFDALQVKD